MGILTRKQGELYVISSDHTDEGPPAKRGAAANERNLLRLERRTLVEQCR